MTRALLAAVFALMTICPGFALAELSKITTGDQNFHTEEWQGKVFSASFRAGMCFDSNGDARGVLLLRHANGKEDTYHLYGKLSGSSFSLSHGSGHSFTGEITSRTAMKGSVKLKNGMRFSLQGTRRINVPLLAEDCAPLPSQDE